MNLELIIIMNILTVIIGFFVLPYYYTWIFKRKIRELTEKYKLEDLMKVLKTIIEELGHERE